MSTSHYHTRVESAYIGLSLNNSDKGAVSHAIFHRALWEYLSQVNGIENEEVQEKMRRSVFEGCVLQNDLKTARPHIH